MILIILGVCLYKIKDQLGPSSDGVMKGYGKRDENILILLDRIQWVNHYPARRNIIARYGLYSIIISFIMSILYESKLHTQTLIQSIIIIWILLLCAYSFFEHHSDKFSSYYIDNNLKHIRRKLKLKSSIDTLCTNKKQFTGKDGCFTFIYKD